MNFQFVQGGSPMAQATNDLQRMFIPANARLQQPGSLGAFNLDTQQMKYDPSILANNLTTIQTQVNTNATNISTNTTDIATNTTDIANLQTSSGTNSTDIATLQGQVSTLQGQVSTMQGTLDSYGTRITNLENRLAAAGIA